MKRNKYRCNVRLLYLIDFLNYQSVDVLDFGKPYDSLFELMIVVEDVWHYTIYFNVTNKKVKLDFYDTSELPAAKIGYVETPLDDRNTILGVRL